MRRAVVDDSSLQYFQSQGSAFTEFWVAPKLVEPHPLTQGWCTLSRVCVSGQFHVP